MLAAIGAAMSALVGLIHGDLFPVIVASSALSTGLAAYLALLPPKKMMRALAERGTRDSSRLSLASLPCALNVARLWRAASDRTSVGREPNLSTVVTSTVHACWCQAARSG